MDTSNRTLALFLAAAIIVSIAGTAISLNKLQALSPDRQNDPTGFATVGEGNVSLTVGQNLAITVPTAYIRFGQCTPASSRAVNISSNLAYGNQSAAAGAACNATGTNRNLPESIIIVNTGNIVANVTMNASDAGDANGGTFLQSTSGQSKIWYQAWNVTNTAFNTSLDDLVSGGCHGTMQDTLRIITSVDMDTLPICDNLENRGNTHNAVGFNVTIQLPSDITTGDSIRFDIWAKASV
jgi:hypothetical protein